MEEEKKTELEETEAAPIDEKRETIHVPWFMVIVMGVLMLISSRSIPCWIPRRKESNQRRCRIRSTRHRYAESPARRSPLRNSRWNDRCRSRSTLL